MEGDDDDDDEDGDVSVSLFVGNLLLFWAVLCGIFLVHIVMVSSVESLWMSKVRLFVVGSVGAPYVWACLTFRPLDV